MALVGENINNEFVFRYFFEKLVTYLNYTDLFDISVMLLKSLVGIVEEKMVKKMAIVCYRLSNLVRKNVHFKEALYGIIQDIIQRLASLNLKPQLYLSMMGLDHNYPIIQEISRNHQIEPFNCSWIEKGLSFCETTRIFSYNLFKRLEHVIDHGLLCSQISIATSLKGLVVYFLEQSFSTDSDDILILNRCVSKIMAIFRGTMQINSDVKLKSGLHDAILFIKEAMYASEYQKLMIPIFGKLLSLLPPDFSINLEEFSALIRPFIPLKKEIRGSFNGSNFLRSAGRNESEWLCQFIDQIFLSFSTDDYLLIIKPVLMFDSVFAKIMLPNLIYSITQRCNTACDSISAYFNEFFSVAAESELVIVKLYFEIIYCLSLKKVKLDLDFNLISKCSYRVGLYLESIWYFEKQFAKDHESNITLEILKCYQNLDDSDGFEGSVSVMDMGKQQLSVMVLLRNAQANNWAKISRIYDSVSQFSSNADKGALFETLGNSGQFGILQKISDSSNPHYESLWRLGIWEHASCDQPKIDHQGNIYNCMKSFECGGIFHLQDHLTTFNSKSLDGLKFLELEECIDLKHNKILADTLWSAWDMRLNSLLKTHRFKELEPLLAGRLRLLSSMTWGSDKIQDLVLHKQIYDRLSCSLLFISDLAIRDGAEDKSRAWLLAFEHNFLSSNLLFSRESLFKFKLLSCQVEWASSDKKLALKFLNQLIDTDLNNMPENIRPEALLMAGLWTKESRAMTDQQTIKKYFVAAVAAVHGKLSEKEFGKYYYSLATYSHLIFKNLSEESNCFLSQTQLKARENELNKLSAAGKSSKSIVVKKLMKQVEIEKMEMAQAQKDSDLFMICGIENYLISLTLWDQKIEEQILKFISIWFLNSTNPDLDTLLFKHLPKIQSNRFLAITYLLAARLVSPCSSHFYQHLYTLVSRMTSEYPYHCLNHIIALKNGSGSKATEKTGISARKVLERLASNSEMHGIINNMDRLFKGYIELSNVVTPTNGCGKSFPVDSNCILFQIERHNLPLITADQPIHKPGHFDDIIRVLSFGKSYFLPGGVNIPRVIECLGSDGRIYKQLVKSKGKLVLIVDDLRQDSVITSVFNIINTLLDKNFETRSRDMSIRTYKIIPLAPQAGVVHWLDSTVPLGELLHEGHLRLRPNDWKLQKCRKVMVVEHDDSLSNVDSKLKVYKQITGNFKPVFGELILELFPTPRKWLSSRRSYTRSVATTSVAGFILGIGDRHSQNILFDKVGGDLIHIDLGVAFDQGKLLSSPELVPFRLTRDIVDAMGICKTAGVFQRGCEEVLKVLRQNSDVIFTLLEVFRFDPLYTWAVSQKYTSHKYDAKEGADLDLNVEAERALFGVRKKLNAKESIECQIAELINSALDESNLCRMYPGWQAWL